MPSIARLQTALKHMGIEKTVAFYSLFNSHCESVELRYGNRKMCVEVPKYEKRGSISLFTVLRNLLNDASGYEEAREDLSTWCNLFNRELDEESSYIFSVIRENSLALKHLIGSERYYAMINLIDKVYGWANE